MASVTDVAMVKTDDNQGAVQNSVDVAEDTHGTEASRVHTDSTNVDHPENNQPSAVVADTQKTGGSEGLWTSASEEVSIKLDTLEQSPADNTEATGVTVATERSIQEGQETLVAQQATERNDATIDSTVNETDETPVPVTAKKAEQEPTLVPRFFSKKHGRTIRTLWTPEEDAILLAMLKDKTAEEIESLDWSALCREILPHRDRQALRQHWYRRLDPRRKTGNWTLEEDILLLEKYQEHGASWIKLSRMIGGRSDMDTLNRFKSITRSYGSPEDILIEKKEALLAKREQSQAQQAVGLNAAEGGEDQESHSLSTEAGVGGDQGLPQEPSAERQTVDAQVTEELKTLMDAAAISQKVIPPPLPLANFTVPTLDELLPQSPEERKQLEDAVQNSARRYNTGQLNKKWWSVKEDVALMHQLKGKTEEELKRFPWAELAKSFPGRDGKSMRDRYVLRLRPGRKTSEWTEEEIQTLIDLQREHGNSWAKISKFIPGRTPADVKNRFNSAAMMKRLNPPKKFNAPPLKELMPKSDEERQALEEKVESLRTSAKGSKNQKWTVEEDVVLMFQLKGRSQDELPKGYWKDLAGSFPGRSRKAIRDRYFLHLHPDRRLGTWTEEETTKLFALHETHGNSWAKISAEIPGRSTDDVRTRFKTLVTHAKRRATNEKSKEIEPSTHQKKRTRSSLARATKRRNNNVTKNPSKRVRKAEVSENETEDEDEDDGSRTRKPRTTHVVEKQDGDISEATDQRKNVPPAQDAYSHQAAEPSKGIMAQPGKKSQKEKASNEEPTGPPLKGHTIKTRSDEEPNSSTGKEPDEAVIVPQPEKLTTEEPEKEVPADELPEKLTEQQQTKPLTELDESGEKEPKDAPPAKQGSEVPAAVTVEKAPAADQKSAESGLKPLETAEAQLEKSEAEQLKKASLTEKPSDKSKAKNVKKLVSTPARRVTRGATKKLRKKSPDQPRESLLGNQPNNTSESSSKANSLPVKKRRRSKEDEDKPAKRAKRRLRRAESGEEKEHGQAATSKGGTKAAEALQVTAAVVAKAIGWKGRTSSKQHTF